MTVNDLTVSWYGEFEGYGAYPTINRNLSAALVRRGWEVYPNWYTDPDGNLPHYFVSSTYPPRSPMLDLPRRIAISTWEFAGKNSAPRAFVNAFKDYHAVWAMCDQAAESFHRSGAEHAVTGRLGIDGDVFKPDGEVADLAVWGVPEDAFSIFWAGGTDDRHGLDIAIQAFVKLPENAWLVLKPHSTYPRSAVRHERIVIVTDDTESLAPFYRAADLYLHSARAVAPAMTVMEALATGCPVISTDLPAVREYAQGLVTFVPSWREIMQHHLHFDCSPEWWQPNVDAMIQKVERKMLNPGVRISDKQAKAFAAIWSWDNAAESLEGVLLA